MLSIRDQDTVIWIYLRTYRATIFNIYP